MEKDDNKSYIDIVDTPPIDTESLFMVNESGRFNRTFKGTI
jgi:hypothetical protein